MEEITEEDLIRDGFQPDSLGNIILENQFVLPNWEPIPKILIVHGRVFERSFVRFEASIEGLKWQLKTRDDLDKFLSKRVPTFCELV